MSRLLMAPQELPSCFSCPEEYAAALLDTAPRPDARHPWPRRLWQAVRRSLGATLTSHRSDSAAAW